MSLQVQGTNDFSIVSKYSMVLQGYFKDEYIRYFVSKKARRSPLINLGYYVRAVVIERILLQFFQIAQHQVVQILSLGAGFDTSFFRLCDLLNSDKFTYFEIDLPDVVRRKSAIIKMKHALLNKLRNIKVDYSECGISSQNYHLLAGDLRQLSVLENVLKTSGFDNSKPTLVLAECSITYMDEISSRKLIQFTQEILHDAVFVTYEQISPDDPFGIVMTNHFLTINSPLLSVKHYPTLKEQENRFISQGWDFCHAVSIWEAFVGLSSEKERFQAMSLEQFDEWEEWHLKCNHYTLVVANKGLLNSWKPFESLVQKGNMSSNHSTMEILELESERFNIKQYGHTSIMLRNGENERFVITVGGFGQFDNGSHRRLDDVRCLRISDDRCHEITSVPVEGSVFNCMHHSCTVFSECDKMVILYGGRQSPQKCVNSIPVLVQFKLVDGRLHTKTSKLIHDDVGICPESRWRHSACIIQCKSYKTFLLFGGCSRNLQVLGDFWKIHLNNKDHSNYKWERITPNEKCPCPRFSHSVAVNNDSMFVSGGLNSKFEVLSDVWEWNCSSEVWSQVAVRGMIPRYGHTSHFVESTLVLIGGVTTQRETWLGVTLINIDSLKVSEFVLPCHGPCKSVMLQNHSSVTDDENSIYIIGGGGSCFSFGTKFNDSVLKLPLSQWILK